MGMDLDEGIFEKTSISGGVYTEAWSFCKPVIGCPIPAVSELIVEGVDGCLVYFHSH
jgi:hypothetical protein